MDRGLGPVTTATLKNCIERFFRRAGEAGVPVLSVLPFKDEADAVPAG